MDATTLDTLAIGLALGAILMRLLERPWWASLLGSISLLASVAAGGRRKQEREP